jgi:hypothetical protein
MSWYAVSGVLYFRLRDVPEQGEFFVWENIYLVNAATAAEARERGEALGKAEAAASDEELSWKDQPAELVYGGIRKVVACAPNPQTEELTDFEKLHDGVEATYSGFTVRGEAALRELISGAPVAVVYEE